MRGDGPSARSQAFSITRTDPALDEIIAADAKLVEWPKASVSRKVGLWIADGNSGY
jgi:hypothetical protein